MIAWTASTVLLTDASLMLVTPCIRLLLVLESAQLTPFALLPSEFTASREPSDVVRRSPIPISRTFRIFTSTVALTTLLVLSSVTALTR